MDNKKLFETSERMWSTFGNKEVQLEEQCLLKAYLKNSKGKVLEAGTGSGRIAFYIENLGFSDIDAFDYVDLMIESAEKFAREKKSKVRFQVADAVDISRYSSDTYDYIVYLQQVLCCIPPNYLLQVLQESYRVLRPCGVAFFSVLNFEGRSYNPYLSGVVNFMRGLYGESINSCELPWLKLNGRVNWRLLGSNQARIYWFYEQEIRKLLEAVGYKILDIQTTRDILKTATGQNTGLYIACTK